MEGNAVWLFKRLHGVSFFALFLFSATFFEKMGKANRRKKIDELFVNGI